MSLAPSVTGVAVPLAEGGWRPVSLRDPVDWAEHPERYTARTVFAAAHVVADPRGENVPGAPAVVDWDATLAFRRHLFRYGFGVAEAMDTAQRNMGLDWPAVQELVRRSAAQAASAGPRSPRAPAPTTSAALTTLDQVRARTTSRSRSSSPPAPG